MCSLGDRAPVEEEEATRRQRRLADERPEELEEPREPTLAHPLDPRLAGLVRILPREARGEVEAAQAVDEPDRERLRPGIDPAVGEAPDARGRHAAPARDRIDELTEHLVDHALE